MKAIKSIVSIALALAVLFCIGLAALAAEDTYTFEVPDEFESVVSGGKTIWSNASNPALFEYGATYITCVVKPNPDDRKINPSVIEPEMLTMVENDYKTSFAKSFPKAELISIFSEIVTIGDYDMVKVSLYSRHPDYGNALLYQYVYLIGTENYVHGFEFTSFDRISDYADEIMATVTINDDPIEQKSNSLGKIIASVVTVVLIGTVIGLVLVFVKRTSSKKTKTYTNTYYNPSYYNPEAENDDPPTDI